MWSLCLLSLKHPIPTFFSKCQRINHSRYLEVLAIVEEMDLKKIGIFPLDVGSLSKLKFRNGIRSRRSEANIKKLSQKILLLLPVSLWRGLRGAAYMHPNTCVPQLLFSFSYLYLLRLAHILWYIHTSPTYIFTYIFAFLIFIFVVWFHISCLICF